MPAKVKVYGWMSERDEPAEEFYGQVRYIVATTSWEAAVVAAGDNKKIGQGARNARRFGSPTGNDSEIKQAMSEPGVAFWMPLKERYKPESEWRRVES